ncbi:hypothetical protein ASF27_03890 [Methylobacterium sp. Leaf102]|uniref:hypothetical protein n=1 Tax=unclassified Methylobacterium TaxID=2615210 RepID=UPI0006F907BA|nr:MULTISPECIES: hypothetical protein [unclassified Methylobacterium]KQO68982.1 hypothetical protein ASF22_19025 [Methylobacterium sp. Leaf87]KQP30103.1 hypothetical protein ASF27_03890 [Methylobacterium sp. Leaf102]KQP68885.1 hypothetical protein ASF52_17140 [Methylobacterium sp. Leaf112]USU31704.1 hypothetical protein NG677_20755 [Methylobacterium sp. OTU13CASTA1]
MRILRFLAVGGLFGVSLTIIGFTCVDRLAHPVVVPAPPVPTLARPVMADPLATGSLGTGGASPLGGSGTGPLSGAPAPTKTAKAARPKAVEGFDTERLNALMRGDPAVTLSRTR